MKKLMMITAPVTSRSGYGDHARDLVTSFIAHDKYDIRIEDVSWGNCPRTGLDENNTIHKKILDCIIHPDKKNAPLTQPDIYVDIRIPQEYRQLGKFNIGITAGIETNVVSQVWMEGCNRMDLNIVPSEHSKLGFVDTKWEKITTTPDGKQNKVGEVVFEKPIEVLFEGVDTDVYKPIDDVSLNLVDDIKEDFAFLFVGMWGTGGFGEDRKDIGKMLKVFYEAFANKKKKPALILKTSGAGFSIIDKSECIQKIEAIKAFFPSDWELPNVYLLHGELSKTEMGKLYNHPKVKSLVSFTHGEGFGRPLLEATFCDLPVIATGWSGQLDFLDPEKSLIVPCELKTVPESVHWENIIIPDSKWADVSESTMYKAFNESFANNDKYKKQALDLGKENRDKFTLDKMTEQLDIIMEKYTKDMPTEVNLNLPKLKRVTQPVEEPV